MLSSDYPGHWSTASTLLKAVVQPCLVEPEPVPQLLGVPGSTWISSSIACASSMEGRRGTPRSVSYSVIALSLLLSVLGHVPLCTGLDVGVPPRGTGALLPDVARTGDALSVLSVCVDLPVCFEAT